MRSPGLKMSFEHKRAIERTPLGGQVVGEVTVYQPMVILDMSERGVQIELAFPLHNDSLHDFRLSLGELSVIVKGRIAYCQVAELEKVGVRYRCGVEFVTPASHALAAIREFVEARRRHLPIIDADPL